ncbi:hypothetical protein U1Q18_033512 [Sarracenia purpurea var. burkii]
MALVFCLIGERFCLIGSSNDQRLARVQKMVLAEVLCDFEVLPVHKKSTKVAGIVRREKKIITAEQVKLQAVMQHPANSSRRPGRETGDGRITVEVKKSSEESGVFPERRYVRQRRKHRSKESRERCRGRFLSFTSGEIPVQRQEGKALGANHRLRSYRRIGFSVFTRVAGAGKNLTKKIGFFWKLEKRKFRLRGGIFRKPSEY